MNVDIAIIGAGAAGLAAAIFAGEEAARIHADTGRGLEILLLEGAKRPGAKILVSGGGRCNVTNQRVTPDDFCGGPRTMIRNVLRAFDERSAVEWMRSMGVELKTEPTGKLFPTTDSARTVVEALLARVRDVGVELRAAARVAGLEITKNLGQDAQDTGNHGQDAHATGELGRDAQATGLGGFAVRLEGEGGEIRARRVVVATGGLALPKSGSDGAGLDWLRRLGHTIIPTTPALAPLVLRENPSPGGRFAELSGVTIDARLLLCAASGSVVAESVGSLLFTHFGLSGPAAMNLSRHVARRRLEHPDDPGRVFLGHPEHPTVEKADAWLLEQAKAQSRRAVSHILETLYPERLAAILASEYADTKMSELSREGRRALAERVARLALDVAGDRGYSFAEATAGGVDLREIDVRTMESRRAAGLHLCGEVLDVDGRIGGFNFQWAWATGYLAGRAAARAAGGERT